MRVLLAALLAATALSPEQTAIRQHVADHAAHDARRASRVGPDAITQEHSSDWLLIPAAGSTPGAAGTFFRSDLMISNHRGTAQAVDISFCQQGVSCGTSGNQLM